MFYFNECSIAGQFGAPAQFLAAFSEVMAMRSLLSKRGLALSVKRGIRQRHISTSETFDDCLSHFKPDQRRTILSWLDRNGPFWEDNQTHSSDDYFDYNGELVTDTGLGEACCDVESEQFGRTVSVTPSPFECSQLIVTRFDDDNEVAFDIPNFITCEALAKYLLKLPSDVESWKALLVWAEKECSNLELSHQILDQVGRQFFPYIAERTQFILKVLDELACYNTNKQNEEFCDHREKYLVGRKALITDSSDTEKNDFKRELTFYSAVSGKTSIHGWHGKIKRPQQYRIHFEWPLPEGSKKIFVSYIGPKITRR